MLKFTVTNSDGKSVNYEFESIDALSKEYWSDSIDMNVPENDAPVTECEFMGTPLYFDSFEELIYVFGVSKVITSPEEMYEHVMSEYMKGDTELNSMFFDFDVRMSVRDILVTYAKLQEDINGDMVLRMENWKIKEGRGGAEDLLLSSKEYDEIYFGNCKDYLESVDNNKFMRATADETAGTLEFMPFII